MTIEIWNAKELPFGPLSNNTIYSMEIDNNTYNTVINYIYSNLINDKKYFEVLKNISTQNIHEYYINYKQEIFDAVLHESFKEGMTIKLKNKKIEDILMLTENYPIIYISDDSILGTGSNGKGKNLVGQYLMETRETLRSKYGSKDDKLYTAYTAFTLLEELIREKDNDLREFAGLNHEEIINKYIYIKAKEVSKIQGINLDSLKYNDIIEKYKNFVKLPDKNIFKMINDEKLELPDKNITNMINGETLKLLEASLVNPYIMILYIKKKYYNNLRISQINRIKNSIFNIYTDHIIEANYPDLPKNKYKEVKDSEFDINSYDLEVLKNEIYNCYKERLLSEKVLKDIDANVDMTIISEEIVKNLKNMNIDYMYNTAENEDNLKIFIGENVRLNENPYSVLSPFAYVNMLNIKGKNYPTVMHYIIASLFSRLPDIKSLDKAHQYLLINKEGSVNDSLNYEDCDYLLKIYDDEDINQFIRLRKKLASKALNKKFEDLGLQELLIATGQNNIVWKDKNDIILGVGHSGKGGDNFIGNYMVELREKFKQNEDLSANINNNDITTIMENDIFMHSWLEMRLKDICSVVNEVQKYMMKKYNRDIPITLDFMINVLKKIYEPCNNLVEQKDINAPIPYYFKGIVNKCFGFKNASDEMISVLWKRIISLIYFLLKYVPKLKNIKNILAKVEIMISQKKKCIHIINNEQDNCIISAIINIITKLKNFNISMKNDTKVSKYDVDTAVNIILSKTSKPLEDKVPNFSSFIEDFDETKDISTVGHFKDEVEEEHEKRDKDILLACKNWKNFKPEDDYETKEENEDQDIDLNNDYTMNYNNEDEEEEGEYDGYFNDGMNNRRSLRRRKQRRPSANVERWKEIEKDYQLKLENEERKKFEKYKYVNKLTEYLNTNDITSADNNILAEYIIDAVNTIKNFKMSNKVKKNRINFFSTSI